MGEPGGRGNSKANAGLSWPENPGNRGLGPSRGGARVSAHGKGAATLGTPISSAAPLPDCMAPHLSGALRPLTSQSHTKGSSPTAIQPPHFGEGKPRHRV